MDAVLRHYAPPHQGGNGATLHIDTQAGPGVVSGSADLSGGKFTIGGESFGRPTTADILGCNSGPFTTGPSPLRNAIIPRLSAAFARSALLETGRHPSGPETFYRFRGPGRGANAGEVVVTNHYARLVHEAAVVDGRGYAFAYDDVQPGGGEDQSGKVNAGDPVLLTVAVGGRHAAAAAPGEGSKHVGGGGSGGGSTGPARESTGGLKDKFQELKTKLRR